MKKKKRKIRLAVAVFLLFGAAAIVVLLSSNSLPRSYRRLLAGLMPVETITPEDLKAAYGARQFKILLVPGHDNEYSGTEFGGVREADLNKNLARELDSILKKDGHFRVSATRDFSTGEYAPIFASYFSNQEKEILSFRIRLVESVVGAFRRGQFKRTSGVGHNTAPNKVLQQLYGINKWANDNNIDVALHIHFNDHASRPAGRVGEYEGFTIYVPEKQFSSSRASKALAESIFNRLKNIFAVSTLPGESRGITEDQELIAVGANGSLDGVGLLIEYGYIYEPQFRSSEFQRDMMSELAYQTYIGIKKYFEPSANFSGTTLLPHTWTTPLKKGLRGSRDVLSLQFALHQNGVYPPPGKDLGECSITGNFGPCTEAAVSAFQEKYADEILHPAGLSQGTGSAGPATIGKLNELYGGGLSRGGD